MPASNATWLTDVEALKLKEFFGSEIIEIAAEWGLFSGRCALAVDNDGEIAAYLSPPVEGVPSDLSFNSVKIAPVIGPEGTLAVRVSFRSSDFSDLFEGKSGDDLLDAIGIMACRIWGSLEASDGRLLVIRANWERLLRRLGFLEDVTRTEARPNLPVPVTAKPPRPKGNTKSRKQG
jgi:hypothetical protein